MKLNREGGAMSDQIPGDHKFPCRWCGGVRRIDPRRRGDHIRCWFMRRLSRWSKEDTK